MPEGLTSVGAWAFSGCTALADVTLPESLTSIGNGAFLSCESLTSLHIPAGVTSIGTYAFSECNSLAAITVAEDNPAFLADENGVLFNKDKTMLINYPDGKSDDSYTVPSGVQIVGQAAFNYCDFSTVVLPEGVTTIESYAFEQCENLIAITIPSSVTSIDTGAFLRCSNLVIYGVTGSAADTYAQTNGISFVDPNPPTNGTCGENLTWVLDDAGTLTISGTGAMGNYNSVTRPWKAHLEAIQSVVIEEGVTSIGNYAFSDCANLVSIQLPAGLISIGTGGFNDCVNLKSITLPDSLTSIGTGAFIYCESLTSLTIPAGVTSIGTWAFSECISLPSFAVAEGNTAFSVDAEGVLFDKDKTVLIAYPDGKTDSSYAIPEGVTTVGAFAFNLCDSLISVTLPDSLTTLEAGAFEDCIGLTSMTIPAGVTMIGLRAFEACTGLPAFTVAEGNTAFTVIDGVLFSADMTRLVSYPAGKPTAEYTIPDTVTELASLIFYQCTNLTSVVIPNSVTSIGSSAFSGCTGLTSIIIPDSVTSIGSSAFLDCTVLTIHGYAGSAAETYASENNIPFVALGANIAPTVNAPVSTESNISITAPEGGWKIGTNTFSVKADLACAVVVSYDGGKTYVRLSAEAKSDGSYGFTAENMTADTIVTAAPIGDANGDGELSSADILKLRAVILGKSTFANSAFSAFGDVIQDNELSSADILKLRATILGKTTLNWN